MPPALSVVVVSLNAPSLLPRCLDALRALEDDSLEIIVVRDGSTAAVPDTSTAQRYPSVRWVSAPAASTVPMMRSLGMREAHGAIVALIEDDCLVQPGWSAAIRHAMANADATGGAVEPGEYASLRDWGVYFCEYGRFMAPLPERATTDLAGMNVAYAKGLVENVATDPGGFYDVFMHRQWADEGRTLRACNTFVVKNVNTWRRDHVTSSPYHHGRAFAAQRFAGASMWRRLGFAAAGSVLLVPLKTARLAAIVATRGRHRAQFVFALPWVVLFNAAWTLGEVVGALFGPGASAARWR